MLRSPAIGSARQRASCPCGCIGARGPLPELPASEDRPACSVTGDSRSPDSCLKMLDYQLGDQVMKMPEIFEGFKSHFGGFVKGTSSLSFLYQIVFCKCGQIQASVFKIEIACVDDLCLARGFPACIKNLSKDNISTSSVGHLNDRSNCMYIKFFNSIMRNRYGDVSDRNVNPYSPSCIHPAPAVA